MATAERLAFVHIMKTAGSYVDLYLRARVLPSRGFALHNSWTDGLGRDWSEEELDRLRVGVTGRAYVHNHVGNWSQRAVEAFSRDGWLTFAFVRHPGDQWCSHYFFARKRGWENALNTDLDEYLARAWSDHLRFGPRRNVDIPDYWEVLDHVEVFSDAAFGRFLRGYLDHEYEPMPPVNHGENRGYEHYRHTGEISDGTHGLLLRSKRFARYQAVLEKTLSRDDRA